MVSENSISTKHDDTSVHITNSLSNKKEENLIENQDSIAYDEKRSINIAVAPIEEKPKEPFTNFSTSRLIQFLVITSRTDMLSPLTGSIYFPATNLIQAVSFLF
jgi:hypothetical protein